MAGPKIQAGHGSPVTLYNSSDTELGTATDPINVEGSLTISPIASTTLTTSQVTISATAVLILALNASRLGATVVNPAGAANLIIGQTSGVTATTGLIIPPGGAYNIDEPLYTGALYGILASGTGQLVSTAELT